MEKEAKQSLLSKYNLDIDKLDFEYIRKCRTKKELEKIIKILRSGEEGHYPDLLCCAEETLQLVDPSNALLRKAEEPVTHGHLVKKQWDDISADLQKWTTDIKEVDDQLREMSRSAAVTDVSDHAATLLPPVRRGIDKQSVQFGRKDINEMKNSQRIPSHDYDSWSKFNVDAELEKLDKNDESRKSSTARSEPDVNTDILYGSESEVERRLIAVKEKDKGNEYYKNGDHHQAVVYYTRSIEVYPTPAAYNNRALVYLKLKDYQAVIADCEHVLMVEPENVKALLRRAMAFKEVEQYLKASLDLQKVLSLEPNNKQAKDNFDSVEAIYSAKGRKVVIEEIEEIKSPMSKDKTQTADADMTETRGEAETDLTTAEMRKDVKAAQTADPETAATEEEVTSRGADYVAPRTIETSLHTDELEPIMLPNSTRAPCKVQVAAKYQKSCLRADEEVTEVVNMGGTSSASSVTPAKQPKVHRKKIKIVDVGHEDAESEVRCTSQTLPIKLSKVTPFEFKQAWHQLRTANNLPSCLRLLLQVPTAQIPIVISNQLDEPMLSTIVQAVRHHVRHHSTSASPTAIFNLLVALTGVNRFNLIVLFLDNADKKGMREVLEWFEKECHEEDIDHTELDSLRKSFNL